MADTIQLPNVVVKSSKREQAAAEIRTTNGNSKMRSVDNWTPSSWTTKPIKQEVTYDDRAALLKALAKLERLPPIVTPTEIIKLRKSLRDVALGKALLLQGGDCAELFDYCEQDAVESKIKLLLQMSLILIWGANKPVVRIARMAGQFAKPRSSPTEIVNGIQVHSFRGDNINGYDPCDRAPDPSRLVAAYFHSASTANYLRASLASGIADLHSPLDWGLGHVRDESIKAQYQRIVESISDSLRFMRTVGADSAASGLETVDLYTSHEGLLLEYEQSLTRRLRHPAARADLVGSGQQLETDGKGWYNTSAHFLWIGDRTREIDGAHVEYFRGLENPVGIKVGPSMKGEELVQLLDIVNPRKEIGKIALITRYGEDKIGSLLGGHIDAVKQSGHIVVWQCDPMHGNTRSTPAGVKTRQFSSILSEVSSALRIHKEHASFLGGVHLELTGDAVTECVGGSEGLTDDDLSLNYTTYCDPRLNEKQALELAFLLEGFGYVTSLSINQTTANPDMDNLRLELQALQDEVRELLQANEETQRRITEGNIVTPDLGPADLFEVIMNRLGTPADLMPIPITTENAANIAPITILQLALACHLAINMPRPNHRELMTQVYNINEFVTNQLLLVRDQTAHIQELVNTIFPNAVVHVNAADSIERLRGLTPRLLEIFDEGEQRREERARDLQETRELVQEMQQIREQQEEVHRERMQQMLQIREQQGEQQREQLQQVLQMREQQGERVQEVRQWMEQHRQNQEDLEQRLEEAQREIADLRQQPKCTRKHVQKKIGGIMSTSFKKIAAAFKRKGEFVETVEAGVA
ncbi:hypothetical protein MMC13_000431 [Lambiella insularis]|nr:hypothetical protein [Lambiella insularis]